MLARYRRAPSAIDGCTLSYGYKRDQRSLLLLPGTILRMASDNGGVLVLEVGAGWNPLDTHRVAITP